MIDTTIFPADFWWGVATSAYQIEGAVMEGGRGPSIWDRFAHTPGKTLNGETGDVAADHYHRYSDDVALMRDLGVDAYRFSIAWPRIIPEGTGRVNREGIEFYRRLCEELHAAGITPMATLYHWDLPQALEDRGGWLSSDSRHWFAEYAGVVKEELGDLIRAWSTLNEPWCSAFLGYSHGEHAPGMSDPAAGFIAAHNLMLAHHDAVDVMRHTMSQPDDFLGVVLNVIPAWPATDDPRDHEAAAAVDANQNRLFLDAVMNGTYQDQVRAMHRRLGLEDVIDSGALAEAHRPIDYLGVNYYNVNRIRFRPGAPAPAEWPGAREAELVEPPGPHTEMGWGVEPEGMTWMLERVAGEYPAIPLMICENGAAFPDDTRVDGRIEDTDRIRYLESHIEAVATAISRGVDVRGYFVWSLIDNFEWSKGYAMRFGLAEVDPVSLDRTLKASGHWYRDLISRWRGSLDH